MEREPFPATLTLMSRISTLALGVFLGAASVALAETPTNTALGAIKLLPKGTSSKVALVEAREGRPTPDRWHILVHDPKEESGIHEYVVAGGEIVASRSLSQFAESLSADDIFGDVVKVDSDKVTKLVQQYAEANSLSVVAMNFELKKGGTGAAPIWNVTCMDGDGNEIGHLVLTATKGTILSHEGFALDPASPEKVDKPKEPAVIAESTAPKIEPDKKLPEAHKVEVKRAEPIVRGDDGGQDKPGLFKRAGNSLQHLFTGHDSGNRPAPTTPIPQVVPPQ